MKSTARVGLVVLGACAIAGEAAGQRTAALAGRVSADSGRAPVGRATIRLPG